MQNDFSGAKYSDRLDGQEIGITRTSFHYVDFTLHDRRSHRCHPAAGLGQRPSCGCGSNGRQPLTLH